MFMFSVALWTCHLPPQRGKLHLQSMLLGSGKYNSTCIYIHIYIYIFIWYCGSTCILTGWNEAFKVFDWIMQNCLLWHHTTLVFLQALSSTEPLLVFEGGHEVHIGGRCFILTFQNSKGFHREICEFVSKGVSAPWCFVVCFGSYFCRLQFVCWWVVQYIFGWSMVTCSC